MLVQPRFNIFFLGSEHDAFPNDFAGSLIVHTHDIGFIVQDMNPTVEFRTLKLKS